MKTIDIAIFRAINDFSKRSDVLDFFFIALSADLFWFGVAITVISWLLIKRDFATLKVMILASVALGISDLISFEVVKQTFKWERPCWELENIKMVLGFCGGSYGFTSNHAANAAAFSTTLFLRSPFSKSLKIFFFSLAFLVGLSRIYLGVHYPSDVVGGFILGAIVSVCVVRATDRFFVRGNWKTSTGTN